MRACLLLALLLLAAAAAAAPPVMSPAEIRPGMQGYGLTVFSGTEPETFAVEALGVLTNAFPGRDLILIRAHHPVTEKAGIIAGMSGSPVYFNGRWAGAVGYSFSFQKEPLGLVTPAAAMLATLDDTAPAAGAARRLAALPDNDDDGTRLRAIGAPLAIGGITPRVCAEAAPLLRRAGLLPVQGGSGGTLADEAGAGPEALVPGAAFGIQLARGDVDFTAIGTVTWREGDRLLGFGHPMFQFVEGEYPLCTARILAVNASYASSFKLGVGLREVGVITSDRAPAVGGVVGPRTPMVPVEVAVTLNGRTREMKFECVRHPYVFFPIASMAVASAVEEMAGSGEMLCRTTARYRFRGYPEVTRRDTLYAPGMLDLYEALFPLSLQDNPWERLTVEHARLEIELTPGRHIAELESVRTDHLEVRPGEQVTVEATLRPFAAPRRTVPLTFTVPDWLEEGTRFAAHIGPASELMQAPPFNDLAQILAFWQELGRGDDLQLTVELPRATQYRAGRAYPDLPATAASVLNAPTRTVPAAGMLGDLLQVRAPAGVPVSGSHSLRFTVRAR